MTLDTLVSQLQQVHGDALQTVVLYGSAASGEQVSGQSDVNVMALTSTLPFSAMRALGQTMRAWQEAGNPPVLELTVQEWRASSDIFPMEYADILERHKVLHGMLPLDGLCVHLANLRLQVEQEAMGKLLRLRRGVMLAGTDHFQQQDLVRASLSTLLVIFRAVLRLHGLRPSRDSTDVVQAVATRCGFDAAPFIAAAALKRGGNLEAAATEQVLDGYVTGMAALVAYLDQFTPPPDAPDIQPDRGSTGLP
jgi:hypothetical protein